MTDMRATERLLEVIADSLGNVIEPNAEWLDEHDITRGWLADAVIAITELRRRGDTLVRRDDLIIAFEVRPSEIGTTATADTMHRAEAMRRLENAIGGKP